MFPMIPVKYADHAIGDRGHGSPYDRGRSDSYYGRSPKPHKWLDSCGYDRVELTNPAEIAEYLAGFQENEEIGDHKDWGEYF